MINKNEILTFLKKNDIDEVEEIEYKEDAVVLRFYYDFDSDELSSAKAYANDECDEDAESDEWYDEFLLPYLNDIAIDNVGEILEELMENLNLDAQYVIYETDRENFDYCEFVALVSEKGKDYEIEEVLDELEL